MNRIADIQMLCARFDPAHLEVKDFSRSHKHHQAYGEGSHIEIIIASDDFAGKTAIERERLIHHALAQEFKNGLHALRIQAFSLKEFKARGGGT